MRLIGKDCAIQITNGGVQDGSPNWGTATSIKAFAESIQIDDSLDTVEVTSLGDTRKRFRAHVGQTTVEITLRVPSSGPILMDALGNYVRVEFKPLSTMGTYLTYTGLLTSNRISAPDGPQQQTLTITCDAETS